MSAPSLHHFRVVNDTQEKEDAYDVVAHRNNPKPSGAIPSIAHLVKGALGAGILSGHVSYKKAGVMVAVPLNILLGVYMTWCLHVLVQSAQILYRRTGIPSMTYPDVGEAALRCFPNPKIGRYARVFRYIIDTLIMIDLFGSCCCYQIIIAKSIKQLVEDVPEISVSPRIPGYPDLRIYLAAMIVPCILICLLRYLQWLAPFSIVANAFVVICIGMTINYAFENNPKFQNLSSFKSFDGLFEYLGMIVFSMSCSGVVIPVENNMRHPDKFPIVLVCGMCGIVSCTVFSSFFGYAAFLEKSDSPITLNFPQTLFPKIIRGCIAFMIYITHALNFWVPFQLAFHYMQKCHKKEHRVMFEYLYRAIIVLVIGCIAIAFPSINALMGFLGCFCLSNMAFIWPNFIQLLVIWHRPGLGRYKWRLWRCILFIFIGLVLWSAGTVVSVQDVVDSMSRDSETQAKLHGVANKTNLIH